MLLIVFFFSVVDVSLTIANSSLKTSANVGEPTLLFARKQKYTQNVAISDFLVVAKL